MKILQLTNRIPFPLHDGGNIGVHYYTAGYLDAGVSLSMLAMNTSRHYVNVDQLPDLYHRLQHFVVINVNNDIRPLGAIKSLLLGTSYNIVRFISKEFESALIALLQRESFDIIQLEGLYLTPYMATIRQYSKAKIAIRQHNIEYRIWERLAAQEQNLFKRTYLQMLAARLKQFELKHINDYDIVLAISKQDQELYRTLGCRVPVYLHPFGVDSAAIPYLPGNINPVSLYHIGAMDWLPNQESVNWLLEQVMPLLQESLPQTRLYLAGRNMPEYYFRNQWKNVEVLGEVPDARAFESDKTLLLVPLQSGGGVRIKIFQGMAMGKCIITTGIGMEGIDARDGRHILLADAPATFAQKIIDVVRQPEQILRIGNAARKLIAEHYDQQQLIRDLLNRYQELLKSKG